MGDIKSIISGVIGVPVSDAWDVKDSKPDADLYLIHYNDNANMNTHGHLRGIIIDIKEKFIVCDAYKYTPVIKSDNLKFDSQGKLELYDTLGNKYVGESDKIRIVPGFEVVTIRVFLHRGIVYHSTYRKIDVWTSDSRWGGSIPFNQMAKELQILNQETLFPQSIGGGKLYSNYVHIFMLVHRGILNVTKADIGNGYIVYGGTKKIWNTCSSLSPGGTGNALPVDQVDSEPVVLTTTSDIEEAKKNLILLKPNDFNLNQANWFLKHGYYDPKFEQKDNRLNNGEFVIIYLNTNPEDPFSSVIRVESPSYHWRSMITDDNPNLKFRFFQLMDMLKINTNGFGSSGVSDFRKMFPYMSKYKMESIVNKANEGYIHFWPAVSSSPNNEMMPLTSEDKMYNIWVCLIMAVPLHKQKQVINLYNEYMTNKEECVNILFDIDVNEKPEDRDLSENVEEFSWKSNVRIFKLIDLARKRAIDHLNDLGLALVEKTALENLNNDIKYNLQYLINGEQGSSLYRIYRDCMKYKTERLDRQS